MEVDGGADDDDDNVTRNLDQCLHKQLIAFEVLGPRRYMERCCLGYSVETARNVYSCGVCVLSTMLGGYYTEIGKFIQNSICGYASLNTPTMLVCTDTYSLTLCFA